MDQLHSEQKMGIQYIGKDFAVHSGLYQNPNPNPYQNHPFIAGVCKCSIDNFSFHIPLHAKDSEVEIAIECWIDVD